MRRYRAASSTILPVGCVEPEKGSSVTIALAPTPGARFGKSATALPRPWSFTANVGPGSGGYNYRVIPKEPTAARHLQFAQTAATALTLIASRLPKDRGQIASHFSPTVRGLLHCWAAEGSPTMAALKPVTRELIALARHNGWGTRVDRLALRLMIGGLSVIKPLVRTMLSARLRLIGTGHEGKA